MKKRYWTAGGVVVIGGALLVISSAPPHRSTGPTPVHHTQEPKSKSHPKAKVPNKPKAKAPSIPKTYPAIPTSGSSTGSAAASFKSVVGQTPPVPLQIVSPPWAKTTQWAIEPLGMQMNGNSLYTLWFGDRTHSGPWHWMPTTLPGEPPSQLPAPIRESIIMAYSLHLGDSGPTNTVGNITWQGLQGHVANPSGWTLSVTTNPTPPFAPALELTLYQQSFTGSFSGYYGAVATFDTQNAATGLHGLFGFISRSGSLASIVATPPHL